MSVLTYSSITTSISVVSLATFLNLRHPIRMENDPRIATIARRISGVDATRELLRPIPRHFSRCGANREAASVRVQLGHTEDSLRIFAIVLPNISTLAAAENSINKH
ncbi:hypothetical protein BLOT_015998 [Blomia tropicalis]|nr:hypothetical protein BLOT_015998 [Blomia tropicalis]